VINPERTRADPCVKVGSLHDRHPAGNRLRVPKEYLEAVIVRR
jgi:hypothetical protein